MSLEAIISYLGLIGIGGIAGVILKHFLDRRTEHKKLLFETRTRAYSGLVGRIYNLFQELDITSLKEAPRFTRINQLLSEAYLLGSNELIELLGEFKVKINEFHNELEEIVRNKKQDESRARKIRSELLPLVARIHERMRKDLYIKSNLYSKKDLEDLKQKKK